jgi:hypothetical protein
MSERRPKSVRGSAPHEDVRSDVVEGLVREIHTRSLDRVMKVSLRLMALASFAGSPDRDILLDAVDQLDAAVRNVRDMFFPAAETSSRPTPTEPADGGVEMALLDESGTIVWTNPCWDDFCRENGGDPRRAGVGRSWVAICEEADDELSAELADTIRTALRGRQPVPARFVLSCPAPDRPRAFDTLVSSRFDDRGAPAGAQVTLTRIGLAPARHDLI